MGVTCSSISLKYLSAILNCQLLGCYILLVVFILHYWVHGTASSCICLQGNPLVEIRLTGHDLCVVLINTMASVHCLFSNSRILCMHGHLWVLIYATWDVGRGTWLFAQRRSLDNLDNQSGTLIFHMDQEFSHCGKGLELGFNVQFSQYPSDVQYRAKKLSSCGAATLRLRWEYPW